MRNPEFLLTALQRIHCAIRDAVVAACEATALEQMATVKGVCFLRTSRPKTPVIYGNDEQFPIGGAKVLRTGDKVTVVGAGVTLFEALKAADTLKAEGVNVTVIDAYSIKPLGKKEILAEAKKTNNTVITVEDHYSEGGLGDAVDRLMAGLYANSGCFQP